MDWRPWSDVPADILREISSRICAPAQFVYFHVVCKHWRASHDPLSRTFLPWLLAPPADKKSTYPRFRCIFSKSSYHVMPPPPEMAARNWVSGADGTALRYLTMEHHRPTLHDPLTGELTHLPVFPNGVAEWEEENPHGVIYGDGTAFLYSICIVGDDARFTAALWRPCSDAWTVLERSLRAPKYGEFCAAYHGGKIMLTVEATLWRIVTPEHGGHRASDLLLRRQPLPWWERGHYPQEYSYVLESRGKLLWVSVKINPQYTRDVKAEHKMWMTVHELRLQRSGKKKTRWIKRDTSIMADRVLFLGTPNSFAVEASRFSGRHGGCAFFVFHDNKALPLEMFGVFSYNLVSNKVNFFERLPRGWKDERCMWHVIQPPIAPIQELMKAREMNERTVLVIGSTLSIHIRRHYEPCLNVVVRNLPLTVKSSQLQLFLSKHGKVSRAEVLYYKNTKRSQGIAIVTMSTCHANHEDALDELNDLSLDGYNLDIRFVKNWQQGYGRRRPRSTSTGTH